MNKIILAAGLTLMVSNLYATEYLSQKPYGMTCEIVSCQDVEAPVNASSWCDFSDASVEILPIATDYVVPDAPATGVNVVDYSDGDQIQLVQMGDTVVVDGQEKVAATYVDGFWWDKYYERYHLNLLCQ